jgi:hypothetical protein
MTDIEPDCPWREAPCRPCLEGRHLLVAREQLCRCCDVDTESGHEMLLEQNDGVHVSCSCGWNAGYQWTPNLAREEFAHHYGIATQP